MATKSVVETPAGETVEIFDDKTWIELTSTAEQSVRQFSGRKPWIVRALWEHGEFTDKSGQAVRRMAEWIVENYPDAGMDSSITSISALMNSPVSFPAFDRKMNGKRTFSVKLVAMPRKWFDRLCENLNKYEYQRVDPGVSAIIADAAEAFDAETRIGITDADIETERFDDEEPTISDMDIQALLDSVPGVDSPTIYNEQPSMRIDIASQVAMSLLTTVVEIISAGDKSSIDDSVRRLKGDLTEVQQRLSQRLSENDSMRRQLRQAGDEIRALRHERDGLRSRLRATEANLTAALKGDAIHAINGEIQRRVDQIMRVAPTSDKGE